MCVSEVWDALGMGDGKGEVRAMTEIVLVVMTIVEF